MEEERVSGFLPLGLGEDSVRVGEQGTSGAMNSGVPQKVLVVALYHMFSLQRP